MDLDIFLNGVGLHLPNSSQLEVTGTCVFDHATSAITAKPRDTVVLNYRDARDAERHALAAQQIALDAADSGSATHGAPAPDSSAPSSSSAPRDRSPRRFIGAGRRCSQPAVPAMCFLELWRLMGSRAYLVPPVAAALRRVDVAGFALRGAEMRSGVIPPVCQEGEPRLPAHDAPWPMPPPPADPGLVVGFEQETGAADLGGEGLLPQEVLQIRVVVLSYQGLAHFHSLWYEAGECSSVPTFLLHDDPDFLNIAALRLILGLPTMVAACWHPASSAQDSFADPPTFLRPAFPGQETVPRTARPDGVACSVVAPASTSRATLGLQPDTTLAGLLPEASTLCDQEAGTPLLPCFILLVCRICLLTRYVSLSPPWSLCQLSALMPVLSTSFVTLTFGSVWDCIARKLAVPADHIYIKRQWPTFDELVVAGRRPAHCFGFRNIADRGRAFQGKGLFVDARPMGRSVCFLEVMLDVLSPALLCTWLKIPVPDEYCPAALVASHGVILVAALSSLVEAPSCCGWIMLRLSVRLLGLSAPILWHMMRWLRPTQRAPLRMMALVLLPRQELPIVPAALRAAALSPLALMARVAPALNLVSPAPLLALLLLPVWWQMDSRLSW